MESFFLQIRLLPVLLKCSTSYLNIQHTFLHKYVFPNVFLYFYTNSNESEFFCLQQWHIDLELNVDCVLVVRSGRLCVWSWQKTLVPSANVAMCAKSFVHRGCLLPASSNTLVIHMLMSIILPQAKWSDFNSSYTFLSAFLHSVLLSSTYLSDVHLCCLPLSEWWL